VVTTMATPPLLLRALGRSPGHNAGAATA
jgi:hypothetical protein